MRAHFPNDKVCFHFEFALKIAVTSLHLLLVNSLVRCQQQLTTEVACQNRFIQGEGMARFQPKSCKCYGKVNPAMRSPPSPPHSSISSRPAFCRRTLISSGIPASLLSCISVKLFSRGRSNIARRLSCKNPTSKTRRPRVMGTPLCRSSPG